MKLYFKVFSIKELKTNKQLNPSGASMRLADNRVTSGLLWTVVAARQRQLSQKLRGHWSAATMENRVA
jgi:hypothetical protein